MKQQICILGSTGSIGTQALDVIRQHSDLYEVYCLTANNRVELLAAQAHEFKPAAVVIANETHYGRLKELLADQSDIKVYAGAAALEQIVEAGPVDMVLAAMVGYAGLAPTICAIKPARRYAWPTRRRSSWPANSSPGWPWSTTRPSFRSTASTAPSSNASSART